MSTIVVLMGLLLLSYLGGFLTGAPLEGGGGEGRGGGLPSGSEYLVVGVVAGPLVLGVVTGSGLETFDPITYAAVGWLALASALEYAHVDSRRVGYGRIALGILSTAVCGAIVSGAAWLVLRAVGPRSAEERLLIAGGLGCVCAETSRLALGWVVRRHAAAGKLTDLLRDLSHPDEVVPIAAVSVLFALRAPAHSPLHLAVPVRAGLPLAVGLVLGVLTAMLLARDLRVGESWGTLLGTSLMTIGLSARLDLAAVTAMFALGAAIAWFSRHRGDIRAMVATTERAVTLPALVLAGARLHPLGLGRLALVIPAALGARYLAKTLLASVLRLGGPARGSHGLLGIGLTSSGGMSLLIGLAMALRFPGRVGDTVLATAVATTLLGELAGPIALRKVLTRAGEIPEPAQAAPAPGEVAGEAAGEAKGAT